MQNECGATSNQTAERVLMVMEAMVECNRPEKLVALAQMLNMNQSTLYRFISALQNYGYVVQHADGRYAMSMKICYLAERLRQQFNFVEELHPFVAEASTLLQESAHLAQMEDMSLVYTDNVANYSQALTIQQFIGKTAPLHCTGIGKLYLSEMSDDELNHYIEQKGLPRFTKNTYTDKEKLQAELERIRKNGYAFDDEECEMGVRCIALPVRDYSGKIAAGISVTGPVARITEKLLDSYIIELKNISGRASERLGYQERRHAPQAEH